MNHFQLDIVIEVNLAAIDALEGVQRRLSRMRAEEAKKFKLDDNLGARWIYLFPAFALLKTFNAAYRCAALMLRALKRIYGDKSQDIIEGLKKNPSVAVPLVLSRYISSKLCVLYVLLE